MVFLVKSVPGASTAFWGWTICWGTRTLGTVGVKSMVNSSTTTAESGPALTVEPPARLDRRMNMPLTASALRGWPSWNFTPLRMKNRHVFGARNSHRSASRGSSSYLSFM